VSPTATCRTRQLCALADFDGVGHIQAVYYEYHTVVFAALNSLDDASCLLSLSMPSEGYDNLLRENGNPAARDLSSDRGKLSAFRKRTTDGYVDETLLTSNKISSTEFILLVVSLSRLGTG
jgi:hypothetical protein